MDECIADCPKDRLLAKRKLTPETWREAKIKTIKVFMRVRRGDGVA